MSEPALAGNVRPGTEVTVLPGAPVESWSVDSARLHILPGVETRQIHARNGSDITLDGATIQSRGVEGVKLSTSKAVIENVTITAVQTGASSAEPASGLNLFGYDATTGSSSAVVKNSSITGVGRGVTAFDGAELSLINTQVKGNKGRDPFGPISGGVGLVLGGSHAVLSGSSVVGDNNGVVMMSGNQGKEGSAAHLVADDGSTVVGESGSAILVSFGRAANIESTIDVRNGSTLVGGNGVMLEVEKGAIVAFNASNTQLVGDVQVQDGSTARLNLNDHAGLTGKMTNVTGLNIDGTSLWVMEGDSSVGQLSLGGGTVDLRGTSEGFHTLRLNDLSGAGTFALGTHLATGESDFLEVSGTATGNHQLLVQNSGVDPVSGSGDQRLVHVTNGDAQFSLIGDQVDFGTFAYHLEQGESATGTDWSLVQTEKLSKSSQAVIGLFSAAPSVWYGESSTLRSRMGELRLGNDQGGGWVRTYGNKQNMSAGGGVAYTQMQQGISLGADMPINSSSGQWLIGLMGGYSQSDLDMKQGTTGTVDSYYVGAYSTWLADDGFYVDALIKANRFQNTSQVRMSDGQKAKGKYNNAGVGASVEVGRHIKLEDDWFVEPFAQASGLLVGGESYDLDNGMRASSNQADSLLGKAGTQVGRTFVLDDGSYVQPYLKVAAAHEFVTGNKVTINGNRFTNDLSGSRIELGAGVAAQVTDVLQVHTDFDFMKGRNIEQPWGVNVGLRYSW